MTSLIILIFVFFSAAAPELSSEQKQEYRDNILSGIKRLAQETEFNRFIEFLGYKESSGTWERINTEGCIGMFQFSPGTLTSMGYGYITLEAFKQDPGIFPPELQLKLLKTLISINEIQLGSYMQFIGKTINGIVITRAGILAGAHLGGVMGVKMYLSSQGRINGKDIFGTSIEKYIKEFQGYNI